MEMYLNRDNEDRIDEVSMEHHEDSQTDNSRRKHKNDVSGITEIDDSVIKNQ